MKSLMSPIPPSSSTQMVSQKTSTAATSSSGTVTMTSISATTDSPSTSTSRRVQQQQHQQQQQATMKAATTTTNTQTSLQASALAKQEVNSSCSDAAVAAAAGGNNTPIASSPDTNGVVIKTEEKDCDDNGSLASSSTSTSTMDAGVATDNEAISNESFIHARPRPILLSAVNPHITCNLCHGYLIDATTIVECLHSFCHSCLIKHLRTEKYCPRCEMMINTAKPNIKPDTTLQAIVYKLVPGLYEKELMRKRAFYKDRPAEAALATPEQRGEDTEQLIFGPADNMSLSLEYADIEELIGAGANGRDFSELRKPRYLQCPAMYTVAHLKKFVHGKFSIDSQRFGIDIMYKVKTIILLDHYTLMDVAYIYTWKRDAPMRFYFRVKESAAALRRFQQNRLRRSVAQVKREPSEEQQRLAKSSSYSGPMTIVHVASAAPATAAAKESPSPPSTTEIKKEKEDEAEQQQQHQASSKAPVAGHRPKSSKSSSSELKHFAVVPYNGGANASTPKSGDLKITLVSKQSPKEAGMAVKTPIYATAAQMSNSLTSKNQDPYAFETNNNVAASAAAANHHKDRKVENIKLKIDLSRQNSVTIINSCSPSSGGGKRKDSSKDKDKEWKVKTSKKDKDKDYGKTAGGKSNAYLTVPPLTIKAERINSSSASAKSPSLGKNQGSPKTRSSMPSRISPPALSPPEPRTEEEKKSLFLKSVALVPISKGTSPQEGSKTPSPPKSPSSSVAPPPLFKIPASVPAPSKSSHATLGGSSASKRKNSEPMKAPVAAKKAKPSSPTLPNYNMDFKIRLPARPFTSSTASTASPVPMSSTTTTTTATSTAAHQTTTTASAFSSPSAKDKPLMPPPSAPVGSMKPPQAPSTSNASWSRPKTPKNVGQNQRVAGGLPGLTPLSPHPLYGGNAGSSLGGNGLVQPSPPGNRTPIAKRYQPILPKAARPNPFANIPCDVNQILKNAGTEIKTINEPKSLTPILPKVYGPKGDAGSTHSPQQQQSQQQQQQQQRVMGPPKAPVAKMPAKAPANTSPANNQQRGGTAAKLNTGGHTPSTIASSNSNNYRNLALYNSSKSRGNDAPPGYRTPIYTPNSPIYSPSSPQYSPNFSIPTVPMYKYTPKPSNSPTSSSSSTSPSSSSSSSPSGTGSNSSGGGTSYLQSILSTNPSMANLFPSPPVQKDSPKSNSPPVASDLSAGNNNNSKGPTHHHHQQQQQQHQTTAAPKRVYPFARSPSPCGSGADEPAEKQSMKSLLNSCNINIPSSLSITITREDSESPSNSGSYPKRKSPVNNYIEILKLPDQQQVAPAASGSGAANEAADTKRSSPPMQKVGTLLGQPQSIGMLATRDKAEEKQPSPPTGGGGGTSVTSQQQQVARKAVPVSTATMPMAPPASGPSMMLNGGTAGKQQQQQQQQKKPQQQQQATSTPGGAGKLTTGTMATTPAAGHFNKASSPVTNTNNNGNGNGNSSGKNVVKASAKSPTATTTTTTTTPSTSPTANTQQQQQQQNNPQTVEKRTPSPEKKAGASGNTPGGNKSPNEQPGAKKFRPILPRQIPTPIPEVIPPKVTSANIIGTYSSPSGVAVKVHAHKKLPIPKVSPTGATGNNTTSSNATAAQQQQHSPNGSSKPQNLVSASALSPPVKVCTGLNLATSSAAATPNSGTPPTVTAAAASKAKARISKAATPPPSIASSAAFTKPPGSPPNTVSSKFMPPPPSPLSVMPPPSMPPPSLTAAAAAAQANDLSKLYRVQQAVAAAAAAQNPSNMLYSYAAAAAQMGLQFPGANLFGYPQALLMGQLSRMQRPGNEVLGEFMMQKLKNPNGDLGGPMSLPLSPPLSGGLPALPPALPASSAKKSEAAGNNNSAKANNKNTKATAATNGVPTSIATSKAK